MFRAYLSCLVLAAACATAVPDAPTLADAKRYANTDFTRSFWFMTFANEEAAKKGVVQNLQAAATVGREDLIVTVRGEDLGIEPCPTRPGDPIAEIARHAQATNIVIINEAHESPRDRHFVAAVLRALKPLGYNIYAAETFNNGAELNHPLVYIDDGLYSSEPIFGRLLSDAKQQGYRFVGYEMTAAQGLGELNSLPYKERITRREIAQTENLMAAIFRDEPKAKVVIHVGNMHAQERAKPGEVEWMAQRLASATGRDPLTISQNTCRSSSGATALADGPNDAMDLYVAHPSLLLAAGRPAWRQTAGDVPVGIPDALLPTTRQIIVEARPVGAPIDTVPVDRVLLRPAERLPLLLPPGRYRLDTTTSLGPGPAGYVTVRSSVRMNR